MPWSPPHKAAGSGEGGARAACQSKPGKPASVNELEGELDLARRPRCSGDDAEAGSSEDVVGKAEVHQVEYVEELGAKFQRGQLRVTPMSEGSVFDEGDVVVLKTGAAKGVASQRTEAAMIRAGASRNIDRDVKEGGILGAASEVVLAHRVVR